MNYLNVLRNRVHTLLAYTQDLGAYVEHVNDKGLTVTVFDRSLDGAVVANVVYTFEELKGFSDGDIWDKLTKPLPYSRNYKYELKQKARGLEKVTVWATHEEAPTIKHLAAELLDHPHCTVNSMRCKRTGKYISLNK